MTLVFLMQMRHRKASFCQRQLSDLGTLKKAPEDPPAVKSILALTGAFFHHEKKRLLEKAQDVGRAKGVSHLRSKYKWK